MSLPTEISGSVQKFETLVSELENALDDFIKKQSIQQYKDIGSQTPSNEEAKLSIIHAYALNSLFYMLLKTQGIQPNDHSVRRELERVKLYVEKIKTLTNPQGPSLRVDQEAARRFVRSALFDPEEYSSSKSVNENQNDQS